MNKSFLLAAFLIVGSFLFGTVQEAKADIFVGHLVGFDSQSRTVGGVAETYLTYDVYQYYDPGAFGWLYYTNPTQFIDQDGGFGVNSYLYAYYPGYRADFTTNDYRVNKVLCTYSEHYVRRVYTPTPYQWSDPYGFDTAAPLEYDTQETTVYNSSQFAESFTSNQTTLVAFGTICIRTPTVESVTFETINSPVTPDNPAFLGGGSRIFPDKQNPADTTDRRTVRVRARLAPSGGSPLYTQGVSVYFRNFDVDDPSADPIIDPMGAAGNDNNGTPQAGTLNMLSATTDANGFATVEFTTTMQPGDNFVIAASTDENYLMNSVGINGTGLQDSSGNQITNTSARARRTDMLSVWRRLHIEVDSMGVSDGNFVLGTIPNGRVIYSRRQATLDISPSPFQLLEENRFENGRLVVGGSFDLDVVSNTATTVTVVNNSGFARVISSNSQFTLYDDDDYNDDDGATGDGTLDGDTGEDIPEPDMSLLTANSDNAATNILAPMYIHPAYDVVDPSDNNFFLSNAYSDSAADTRRLFVDRDLTTTNTDPGFWTVYILGSYQHTIPEDNDPAATELPTFGIADGIPLTILGDGSGALIHLEVHNSKEIIDYPATDPSLRRIANTVGHELGHLLAGRHGDGDIMTDQVGNMTSNQFNPTTIRRVRAQLTHP